MGDELLEILEGQKRLDQQFQQMTSPADRGSLREAARGMSTATEGEIILCPHPSPSIQCITLHFSNNIVECIHNFSS